jgi:hypothetical protein
MTARRVRMSWCFLVVLAIGSLVNTGCTMQSRVQVLPTSHFVPPDATVRELGPAKADLVHGFAIFGIPGLDLETSELDGRVVNMALRQQVGANTLINYVLIARIRSIIPLVSWATISAEGTAAQILRLEPPPSERPAPRTE